MRLAFAAAGIALGTGPWVPIDDMETRSLNWAAEDGTTTTVRLSGVRAASGARSLAVTLTRQRADMVRAAWQADVGHLRFAPTTMFRLKLYGSATARKPHGGLIAVEGGGRVGGGDSHWMAEIDGSAYAGSRWRAVSFPALDRFTQPGWSQDASGRLEPERITKLLFVAQQEAPSAECHPFTVFLDDLEATNVAPAVSRTHASDPDSPPASVRPKLRGFVGRSRPHGAQVRLGYVSGWTVVEHGGVRASLAPSREEPLFEDRSGKVTYRSDDGSGWLALRPRTPVPVSGLWAANAIQVWVFGNNWDWMPDPTTPQPEISVTLRDRSGEEHRLNLGRVNFKFWGVLHKRILGSAANDGGHTAWGGDRNGRLDVPVAITGLEIRNCGNRDPRTLYFDSISVHRETTPIVAYRPVPKPLPFPTRATSILPTPRAGTRATVTRHGSTWELTAASAGKTLVRYVYAPQTGTLSDILVRSHEAEFRPAAGAGPTWIAANGEFGPETPNVTRRLVALAPTATGVRTRWRWTFGRTNIEYVLALSIRGTSLVHEWTGIRGAAAGLSLGQATGLREARVVRVPYYAVMGQNGGAAILLERGVFASHLVDWYVTDCSTVTGGACAVSGSTASYAGSVAYRPLTDGRRNPLHERCVLTVSDRFEEVLPNIPNPASPLTSVLRSCMYTHLGGTAPTRFDGWLAQLREYRKYGIDRLIVTQHEDSWTEGADVGQGPQEYTMTLEGPPDAGGDEAMKRYYRAVRALGHYVGPYNNYTDYSPLGRSWNEDYVTRTPEGEWQRVWPPCYNIRPLKAAEMAEYYAPAQAAKYGVNATYCDVHTCVPPWANVDYQTGTPGAGKMRTTFEAYGRVLMTQRRAYRGPAFSEGAHHVFYSGLIDGSYAQMGLPDPPKQPLLLDFDLRKLHPQGADISMLPGAYWNANEYHCMAATIAYGHAGFFPFSDVQQSCRYYFLVLALMLRYVQVPVTDIGYWDGARYVGVSDALRRDVHKRGQVRVRYRGGLTVHVNYHPTDRWSVEAGGRSVDLCPTGWAAEDDKGFMEISSEADGRRINYVQSPARRGGFVFGESQGRFYDFGPAATDGEFVLKDEGPTAKRLIVIAPTTEVRIYGPWNRASVRDASGTLLREEALQTDSIGRVVVRPRPGDLWFDLK